MSQQHEIEVAAGARFEFGKNWTAFLEVLNEAGIADAERSLAGMLETKDLYGKKFVDIGSGSGLFSLAARRMGTTVRSFDYDPHSVACTRELRRPYFPNTPATLMPEDPRWKVEQGSALDEAYLKTLGTFDIVYSWGVLHHTENMWQALANVVPLVAEGGKLFIALNNDQCGPSRRWTWVKSMYNQHPVLRTPLLLGSFWQIYWRSMLKDMLLFRPGYCFREYRKNRGMMLWRDWVGGYPFEVVEAEQVFDFFGERNFVVVRLTTDDSIGCHQFVFVKSDREDLMRSFISLRVLSLPSRNEECGTRALRLWSLGAEQVDRDPAVSEEGSGGVHLSAGPV